MSLTVEIEHTDGSVSTLNVLGSDDVGDPALPSLQAARIEQHLIRQPQEIDDCELTVYRDAWIDVESQVDRTNDRVVVREDGDIIFGGRLDDWEFDGVVVSLLIDDPKRDAIDAEPSGGNDLFGPQPDTDILSAILDRVPTVDEGTAETVKTNVSFSESQAAAGKSLASLARDADAECRYQTTETGFVFDYVNRLGSDRSDETLSPANGTLLGEPRIGEQVREDVTHIRVLGAGEGTAQITSEAVVSSFDNGTDRAIWRNRTDKRIQQQGRADSLAETLVDEYDGAREYIEIEVEIPRSVAPEIGDTFSVSLPAYGVDKPLRITTLERLIDAAGDRYRAILSNRRHTTDLQSEQNAQSVDEFREGNAGQYFFAPQGSPISEPVADGVSREWEIFKPTNVVNEFDERLFITSDSYFGRVVSGGHSHTVEGTSHSHSVSVPAHTHELEFGEESDQISIPPHLHGLRGGDGPRIRADTSTENQDTFTDHTHTYRVDPQTRTTETVVETTESGGGFSTTSASSASGGTTTDETDLQPGINKFSDETVSNVTVELNGNVVASGLDHPINEEIDVTGQLVGGQNTVEVSSDSLGEIRVLAVVEGIKNAETTN